VKGIGLRGIGLTRRMVMGVGGIRYFLSDDYTDTLAAGSVDGTFATDGKNIRTVVDAENKLSLANGKQYVSDGYAAPALVPSMIYPPFARFPGLTLETSMKPAAGVGPIFGFRKSNSPWWGMNGGFRMSATEINVALDDGSMFDTGIAASQHYYTFYKVILKAIGYIVYVSVDAGYTWTQVYEDSAEIFTPLYPMMFTYNSPYYFDYAQLYSGVKQLPRYFLDDFNRPDTSPGIYSLCDPPNGFRWASTGTALPYISGGKMLIDVASGISGYALMELPATPLVMRGTVAWSAGGAGVGNVVFISSHKDQAISDVVHLAFNMTDWDLMVRSNGGTWDDIGSGAYSAPLVVGTVYNIGMRLNGDTCTIELPDGTEQTVTSTRIGDEQGKYCIYELTGDVGYKNPSYESVYATW
jgi:hypothetical protein